MAGKRAVLRDRVSMPVSPGARSASFQAGGTRPTETSDGNLSVHARRLEETGYLTCAKGFDGRTPRTEFGLTTAGRRALERYLAHMEAIIHRARKGVKG